MAFACPRCHTLLDEIDLVTICCSQDRLAFHKVDGIWRFLLPERVEYYSRFIRDYETIRRSEGRGSADPEYYRTLPYHSTSDWRIRAASFNAFIDKVLRPIEKGRSVANILDLGAGNSWLSNRLASRGHDLVAVDLTVNDFDGLGCYRFYESTFLSVQAEFDHLPFADRSADIVLYNASLHYSADYEKTLSESLRLLDAGGKVVILDSPVYRDPSSGLNMVREREEQFVRQYGFPSDNLKSENFLTYKRMIDLGSKLGIIWRHIRPYYGFHWLTRPWLARILGRREPAEFGLWVGSKANVHG